MKIIGLPALSDNYIWMICDHKHQSAWAVDPGAAQPVLEFVERKALSLCGILLTHHHHDHSGGIADLVHFNKELRIFASHSSSIPGVNQSVREGDQFECLGLTCRVMEIPGHTLDHIAFVLGDAIFCGDTLFSVGCGKVFEGTAKQMYYSLRRLSHLENHKQIYCGHEYTLKNLEFALVVEPHNLQLQTKYQEIKNLRDSDRPTLPSLLGEEKKLNPFLRCEEPGIMQAVENYCQKKLPGPVEVFFHLRQWKNSL